MTNHGGARAVTTTRRGGPGSVSWRRLTPLALACALLPALAAGQPSGPLSIPPPGAVASEQIPALKDVGIDQKLNAQIPLDLVFTDDEGRDVRLGDYFGKRPVLLVMSYYECPMLCTMVLNGVVGSVEPLTFTAGVEFDVVVVSIDPGETPALAAQKKRQYVKRYNRPETAGGWHFLTGRESSIQALTSAIGFRYAYDEAIDQYAHPAAITIATADGRVSRYLFGIEFMPRDVRFGLIDATEGKIGTAVDQLLLYCYHYDPATGKYGLVVMNLVRAGGIVTVLALGASVFLTLRRERRKNREASQPATGTR